MKTSRERSSSISQIYYLYLWNIDTATFKTFWITLELCTKYWLLCFQILGVDPGPVSVRNGRSFPRCRCARIVDFYNDIISREMLSKLWKTVRGLRQIWRHRFLARKPMGYMIYLTSKFSACSKHHACFPSRRTHAKTQRKGGEFH